MRFPAGIAAVIVFAGMAAMIPGCRDQARRGRSGGEGDRTSGAMSQYAYVWQRDWTEPVRASVTEHAGAFAGIAVLGAQLEWTGRTGDLRVVRPEIPWRVPAGCGAKVSAVVRVQTAAAKEEVMGEAVIAEARRLLAEAAAAGCALAGIQIDYDCPQKKLAGYLPWLVRVERAMEPLPLTITTLASWLPEADFRKLIAAADGYVLQVHSFDPPLPGRPPAVCDPDKARVWVGQAAALGRPFTVALPTYRTTAGYDATGRLVGVATDSVSPSWPAGTVMRELPADPDALAALVAEWTRDRPVLLEGIWWYRLPVATDTRNWRWPALAAVMAGTAPDSLMELKMSGMQPLDLTLANNGERDEWMPGSITVNWDGPAPAAGDATGGWSLAGEPGKATFTASPSLRGRLLPAGQSIAIGWLRFHEPAPAPASLHFVVSRSSGPDSSTPLRDR